MGHIAFDSVTPSTEVLQIVLDRLPTERDRLLVVDGQVFFSETVATAFLFVADSLNASHRILPNLLRQFQSRRR